MSETTRRHILALACIAASVLVAGQAAAQRMLVVMHCSMPIRNGAAAWPTPTRPRPASRASDPHERWRNFCSFARLAATTRTATSGGAAPATRICRPPDEGLTESASILAMLPKLRDWAQRQAQRSQFRTVGIYPRRAGLRLQHRGHEAAQADPARLLGRT